MLNQEIEEINSKNLSLKIISNHPTQYFTDQLDVEKATLLANYQSIRTFHLSKLKPLNTQKLGMWEEMLR